MNSAAVTREYLALRISELQNRAQMMIPVGDSSALMIENARIEELTNTLTVLNGGKVPAFQKEATV